MLAAGNVWRFQNLPAGGVGSSLLLTKFMTPKRWKPLQQLPPKKTIKGRKKTTGEEVLSAIFC